MTAGVLGWTHVRLAVLLGAIGCSRPSPSGGPREATSNAPSLSASADLTKQILREVPSEDAAPTGDAEAALVGLVRREAWDEAQTSIEALPETNRRKPTMRLVEGRVAMARGEYAAAVHALADLENDLVPIADDIQRWRAEAQAQAGPYQEAAQYFMKQGGASALARAALAFDKAKLAKEARVAADRAVAAGKGDASEVAVRSLRARLAEQEGDHALATEDLRFIVLRAPADDETKAALKALERLDPSRPLTGRERLVRAERLVDAGRTDDALAELDRAEKGTSRADGDEVGWARAFALYKARGRYEKAAVLFSKLANKKGARQAEALFYSARSQSRADHDDEAAHGYRAVAQRFPTSPWADEATYLAARLAFLHAAWADASAGYTAYLTKFRNGKQRDNATYDRALALLADGKFASARAELRALASTASGVAEAARLRELEAVAARGAGDRSGAVATWNEIVRSQPLSWAAIAARARLTQEGEESPAVIEPADGRTGDPLSFKLPPIALLYHRLGLDSDAENYLRAHEREAVIDLKGREKEGLCALYAELGRAARLYRIGLEAAPGALLARAPSPASEWAWRCLYPRPYVDRVADIEAREGLPRGLIYAVMRQESAYDPNAVSPARAVGLLQLIPETARRIALETGTPFDEKLLRTPALNLDLGGRYLAKMLRSFGDCAPAALASYNAGPRVVRRWLDRMKGVEIDVWVALIPFEETRGYVARVMSNLARYAYLEGGESRVPALELRPPMPAKEESAEY